MKPIPDVGRLRHVHGEGAHNDSELAAVVSAPAVDYSAVLYLARVSVLHSRAASAGATLAGIPTEPAGDVLYQHDTSSRGHPARALEQPALQCCTQVNFVWFVVGGYVQYLTVIF